MAVVRLILAAILGLALLFGLQDKGRLFRTDAALLLLALVPVAVLAGFQARRAGRLHERRPGHFLPLILLTGAMLIFLVSGALTQHWFFLTDWFNSAKALPRRDLFRFVLWTALLTPLCFLRLRRLWIAAFLILIVLQVQCVQNLFDWTGGRPLYRTDHPSFLFRLWEFGALFPNLVAYAPQWNGGVVDAAIPTSGTGAPGLLMWPFLQFHLPHEFYNVALLAIFVVLIPWLAVGAVRAAGGDRLAAGAGGVLALGVSHEFFLWALHFGTIGAAVSSAMALPVSAFAFRAVWLRRREPWLAAALVLTSFLLLQWPANALTALALAAALLVCFRRPGGVRQWMFLVLCGVALVVMLLPLIVTVFTAGRHAVDYVANSGAPATAALGQGLGRVLKSGLGQIAAHLVEVHPLILFLGLAGAVVSPYRGVRRWFLPALLVLLAITGWAKVLKPQSQLWRMAIPMAFIAVVPAALHFARLVRAADARFAPLRAALLVLLTLGGYHVTRIYANRSPVPLEAMPDELATFTGWIRANVPEGGRLLFGGRCNRVYGGGYVAYLPALAGREMMASDYYNFPPGFGSMEYPPAAFQINDRRLRAFLDAYNVTHAATSVPAMKDFFGRRPELFEPVWTTVQGGFPVQVYRVRRDPTPLHGARGRVQASFNRLDVRLDEPADTVVLPYNWVEGLRAAPPVALVPSERPGGIRLIGVHPNGARNFVITYHPPLKAH